MVTRIRFYLGRKWLGLGLWIMPSDAKAYFGYNIDFLRRIRG